ncbi:MAG: FAD-dependent oxidoreductase, partial [Longimicrobiales bacterium]|nr:FAD-dependent oxidoreductase [Longimicrobiales bacterium]
HLTSTSILELDEVPRHLAILGGGPVGLEFAQMFARFGAAVTIVELGSHLLDREDPDVSEELRSILEDEGVTVWTDAETRRVEDLQSGGARLVVDTPDGRAELVASHLLVAAGRIPNSDLLDLDKAGVDTDDQGYILVDDRCRTVVPGIWALGDVTGSPPFTHIAYDDYRVVAADVLPGREPRSRSGRQLPYCIYTDPELGRVGLTEREAEEQGRTIQVAKLPMSSWARAIEMGETRGFVKCLVDPEDEDIVGVAALGVHGGEIMSVLQTAMMGGLPYTAIRDGIYAHPTLAESLQNLFATVSDDA